jgi:hypothetical protein
VTFKDLQKLVGSQAGPEQTQILQRLGDKEFWYWDQTKHKEKDIRTKGGCCFKHIVGLPRKDGIEKSLFDYEKLLYRALVQRAYLNSDPSLHQMIQTGYKQDKVTSDFHYLQLAIKYVQGQMDHLNKSEKVLLQDTQDNKTKEEEENIESQKTNNGVF